MPSIVGLATKAKSFSKQIVDIVRAALSSGELSVATSAHTHTESDVTGLVSDLASKISSSRAINTTAPVTGGGDLSADRTIAVSNATTTTVGVVELATSGESAANVVVQGNDARLSDARTPNAHASTHLSNGSDPVSAATATVRGTVTTTTATSQVVSTDDSRMTDARTPTAHATSHKSGGSDAVKLDELAAPTDVTTLNASTSAHGLMPKLTGSTTTFFRSDGTQATPTAAVSISQTEVDFGTSAVSEAEFVVVDAAVTASSKIVGTVAYVAPTGKDLDELEMDALDLRFAPGTGQFTLYISGADGPIADKFKINYLVG